MPRQKYGLTERDAGSGLDHTWFRKHETRAERWTSPDPYDGSMSIGNPQSFNRYSYVTNDPVSFIDPTGLYEGCVHDAMTKFLANLAGLGSDVANSLGLYAGANNKKSADAWGQSALNPKNVAKCMVGVGPSVVIHFPNGSQLSKNIQNCSVYMGKEDYVNAAYMIHSIEDSLGAHSGYSNSHCQGHARDGTKPDRIIGDDKFFNAANRAYQVMSGNSNAMLTDEQKKALIKAVIEACGNTKLDNRYVPPAAREGGGGGDIGRPGHGRVWGGRGWSVFDMMSWWLDQQPGEPPLP